MHQQFLTQQQQWLGFQFAPGTVVFEDQPIAGTVPDGVGAVFQEDASFPWLTVRDNIAFGLRERGVSEAERGKIADGFIERVGLTGFENHWPKQLSGLL